MSEPGPTQRFIGSGLMAVGGAIMGLTGLCTMAGLLIVGPAEAMIALAIGGAPFVVGVLLFIGGRGLRNGPGVSASPPTDAGDDAP